MRVAVHGYFFEPSGYGEFARLIAATLLKHCEHDVVPVPMPLHPEPPDRFGWKGKVVYEAMRPIDGADVTLVIADPESFRFATTPCERKVAFTMFERETRLSLIAAICDQMHHVIVPTEWNKRALEAQGISPGISVVPPPLDVLDWPVSMSGEQNERFTFFANFDWSGAHKDPLALLEAYFMTFGPDEPVLLRIKTAHRELLRAESLIKSDIMRMAYVCDRPEFPPVEIILGSWTRSETLAETFRCDTFVAPHKAEGWGLPLFEAMGLGVPCIATRFGGSLAFADDANSTLIDPLSTSDGWASLDAPGMGRAMRRAYEAVGTLPRDGGALGRTFSMEASAAALAAALWG